MAEIMGQWWFEGEELRVLGNLKLERNNIELTLNHGVVAEHIWDRREFRRGDILGELSSGQRMSLIRCREVEASQGANNHKVSRYVCEQAYSGAHFTSRSPAMFDSIHVTFDFGTNWVGERPYIARSKDEDAMDHRFAIYFDTSMTLFEEDTPDGRLKMSFRNMPDFLGHEFSLKSPFVLSLSNTTAERTAQAWRAVLEPYRWLLSLLLGQTMTINYVSLHASGGASVVAHPPFPNNAQSTGNIRPAFSFKKLRAELSALLSGWRSQATKYAPACELLFDEDSYSDLPSRFEFLLHAQVLEAIYRRGIYDRKDGKLLQNYKPIRNQLLDVIQSVEDQNFIEAASARINQLNELPLRLQFERFTSTFNAATLEAIGMDGSTIRKVTDMRHHFTHTGREEADFSIASSAEVYEMTRQLRFLAFIYLLKEAGLHERDCVYCLGGVDEFRWLIDFDAFNHPKHEWQPADYGQTVSGKFMRD